MNYKDPLHHFKAWYDDAASKKISDIDSMVLATASKDGRPSARVVLFKGIENGGFVFFTNYQSRKGQEILENPFASLVFYWPSLRRQIRIEGTIEPLSSQTSDDYWKSRPRESQLSGFISEQSQTIPSFDFLAQSVREAREKFNGKEIPRPEHWGGFRVIPETIEFWVGQENRLHHRTRYQSSPQGWTIDLLSP
jgi:pyridoxamine 5'-phosphate oxidase